QTGTPAVRQLRSESPSPGDSTLTTSAPRSASCRVSILPATTRERSTTRKPASGPGDVAGAARLETAGAEEKVSVSFMNVQAKEGAARLGARRNMAVTGRESA